MSSAAEKEPMPDRTRDNQVEVFPLIHEDLNEREELGRRLYHGPLVTNDGRKNMWDTYQESLDLAVYLRKEVIEREVLNAELENLKDEIAADGKMIESQRVEIRELRDRCFKAERRLKDIRLTLE